MRAQSQSRSAFPATVIKAGMGYCSTHYAARAQKRSLPGDRKIDYAPIDPASRKAIAERWSETDGSTALAICGVADSSESAFEVMSMLGLFDEDPYPATGDLRDPKGVASGRYW